MMTDHSRRLLRVARALCDIGTLLRGMAITVVIKLIFPHSFSWLWIGVGLIAWLLAAVIICACLFDELSRPQP
jgi:uncharacterized membrane protein